MKLKAFSLIMIASLLASMLLIGIGTAQFLIGATAVFLVKLPNGTQYMNVTTAQYDVGDKFNITVAIHNVTTMTAYGLTIVWNATFQNATGNWWLSSFFMGEVIAGRWSAASVGYVGNDYDKDVLGGALGVPLIGAFVGLGQSALKPKNNVTGDFDICKIEFQINAYGPHGFYIWKDPANYAPWPYAAAFPRLAYEGGFPPATHPTYSGWMTPPAPGVKQSYDVIWWPKFPLYVANALLWIQPPAPKAPTAVKTLSPSFPKVNETVTATVTQTKPAFNGTHTNDISQVTIDWGDTSATETLTGPSPWVFTHEYTASGPYLIKVYCFAAHQPPGTEWCNLTNPITIIPVELTGIDVYQVRKPIWPGDPAGKAGEGLNIPGRPYDPQSLVVLEAYVFYNGEPVQCKIVSFEVKFGEECILYRTDMTGDDPDDPRDADGIAWIEFRIPELCWDYGGPEALFGKWFVIVTVEMCEVKFNDTMMFDMGYILTLSNMVSVLSCQEPEPWETFKKCEYVSFNVDITNIDWYFVPATIILVVYDDNEVPIGQEILGLDVPPGEYCSPTTITFCIALHIPKYAYVGTGTGYINLFTALPSECGLAYCPEVSDQFLILKT